jgi:hypothetical protein
MIRLQKLENFAERYLIAKRKEGPGGLRKLRKEVFAYNKEQRKKGGITVGWDDVKGSAKRRKKARDKGYGENVPKYMRKYRKKTRESLGLQ